jgi:hypothetical protein
VLNKLEEVNTISTVKRNKESPLIQSLSPVKLQHFPVEAAHENAQRHHNFLSR